MTWILDFRFWIADFARRTLFDERLCSSSASLRERIHRLSCSSLRSCWACIWLEDGNPAGRLSVIPALQFRVRFCGEGSISTTYARLAFVLITLFFALHPITSHAADLTLDHLLYDATRYGDTPVRREAREAAKAALLEQMPEAMHAAMRHIHGDNIMIQVLMMEWVQSQPGDVVTPALLDYLEDEREQARRLAIFFLGFHDTPEHAEKIMPHLEDESTRGATLRTLGKWKVPQARAPAEYWLREGKERLRVVAANTLRDLGDPEAIPALTAALDDPVFTVRHAAARAIVLLAGDDSSLLPATAPNQRLLERIRADAGAEDFDSNLYLDGGFFLP